MFSGSIFYGALLGLKIQFHAPYRGNYVFCVDVLSNPAGYYVPERPDSGILKSYFFNIFLEPLHCLGSFFCS